MKVATTTVVKTKVKAKKLPKMKLKTYLNEQTLSSVSGAPSVYAKHTDGTRCDTSAGCNCGS